MSSKPVVPEAKKALDKFKMEAANEVGVNLQSGYNGNLSSKEAGSVGGQMVKSCMTIRTFYFSRPSRITNTNTTKASYIVGIAL